MKYYIVDAFSSHAFGGNTAGVVLLEKSQPFPADKLMQQVAAELRYSETAFVQKLGSKEFRVRYFTPCCEVDLCGHATIATFGLMYQLGLLAEGDHCSWTISEKIRLRMSRVKVRMPRMRCLRSSHLHWASRWW